MSYDFAQCHHLERPNWHGETRERLSNAWNHPCWSSGKDSLTTFSHTLYFHISKLHRIAKYNCPFNPFTTESFYIFETFSAYTRPIEKLSDSSLDFFKSRSLKTSRFNGRSHLRDMIIEIEYFNNLYRVWQQQFLYSTKTTLTCREGQSMHIWMHHSCETFILNCNHNSALNVSLGGGARFLSFNWFPQRQQDFFK